MAERTPKLRLFDVLNSIAGIEQALTGKSYAAFAASDVLQRAIERWLEIVSEARRHIPSELKAQALEVPWRAVEDFGNKARRSYQSISSARIWEIVQEDMGPLKAACSRLYADVKAPADPWPDAGSK